VYPNEDKQRTIIHSTSSRHNTTRTSLLLELKPAAIRAAATTRAATMLTLIMVLEKRFVILMTSYSLNGIFVEFGYKVLLSEK
jgi:hypothetical protein